MASHPQIAGYELAVHLLNDGPMASLNETFLNHTGPTDVITFDHAESPACGQIHGEVFICVDEALRNARTFRCSWEKELVRYFVHGCLHLLGYDDKSHKAREVMKKEENRWVRLLSARFALSRIQAATRVPS